MEHSAEFTVQVLVESTALEKDQLELQGVRQATAVAAQAVCLTSEMKGFKRLSSTWSKFSSEKHLSCNIYASTSQNEECVLQEH